MANQGKGKSQQQTTYSTQEVAAMIGVHRSALLRWMRLGHLPEPRHIRVGGILDARIWTERDVARARKVKEQIYQPAKATALRKPQMGSEPARATA